MVATYFLLPDIKHKLLINKKFALDIVNFGKWISLSSVVYFLALNFDRLYFAKVVPLAVLASTALPAPFRAFELDGRASGE